MLQIISNIFLILLFFVYILGFSSLLCFPCHHFSNAFYDWFTLIQIYIMSQFGLKPLEKRTSIVYSLLSYNTHKIAKFAVVPTNEEVLWKLFQLSLTKNIWVIRHSRLFLSLTINPLKKTKSLAGFWIKQAQAMKVYV